MCGQAAVSPSGRFSSARRRPAGEVFETENGYRMSGAKHTLKALVNGWDV
jgi:hypothetical protein